MIYRFLPGFFSRIAILAGLVLGTLVATALGLSDFSKIGQAQWFAVSTPFHFGAPQFSIAAIVSMTIVMLVIMTETTADILAVGEVVDRPADGRDRRRRPARRLPVHRRLRRPAQLLLRQRLRPERRAGRHHGRQEPLRRRRQRRDPGRPRAVPEDRGDRGRDPDIPVLGGAGLALFGTVAASGIRALSRVNYEGNNNLVIVALSIAWASSPSPCPPSTSTSRAGSRPCSTRVSARPP